MPRVSMTDRFVAGARPKSLGQRTGYFDTVCKGLELLAANKSKTWYFHFQGSNGKRARVKLGSYPATSLAVARGLAVEARGHVEAGKDARQVFAAQDASAMTVADLIDSYLTKHVRPNLKSADHMELRLNANVLPVIGTVKMVDLHRRDVNRVIDPIVGRGRKTQARLVFQDMRAILRWAVARGDLDQNPIEGMERPSSEKPRERVLSDDEIRTLWHILPAALAKSENCQRIIKLCLVTSQRVGEVSGMRRDELDLKARTWSLPGTRTKNGHPHQVPLSSLAVDLIEEALEAAGKKSAFVFPVDGGSLPPHAVARSIGRAHETSEKHPLGRFGIAQWTAHDLRRSALTGMAKLGISPTILGFVANHRTITRGGITMGVYVHYAHEREKREALELWAARLQAIVAGQGATVVPMVRAEA